MVPSRRVVRLFQLVIDKTHAPFDAVPHRLLLRKPFRLNRIRTEFGHGAIGMAHTHFRLPRAVCVLLRLYHDLVASMFKHVRLHEPLRFRIKASIWKHELGTHVFDHLLEMMCAICAGVIERHYVPVAAGCVRRMPLWQRYAHAQSSRHVSGDFRHSVLQFVANLLSGSNGLRHRTASLGRTS
ncbi:protein of unknown function (plasmid) [Paraburkholderia dioscoreae]|uniref:Uncharacterized protein n=1 Tax=Paraburkholderia dioscoreae TaxID=2604047 RepID=A0A5Q4ZQX4_9BURK|nr:protein of unknown function [Paraburkholderia dioscoreae]